jgi:iron complex outermembrane receptor protein
MLASETAGRGTTLAGISSAFAALVVVTAVASPPKPGAAQAAQAAPPNTGQPATEAERLRMAQAEPETPTVRRTESLPRIVVGAPKQRPKSKARPRTVALPLPQPAPPSTSGPSAPVPATAEAQGLVAGPPPVKERYQLPQTSETVTGKKLEQTTNIIDTQDAVKYLPSLFVRKRNYGDNQSVLATRTWGLNSSARSMIYVDDILISNYQGNNNSNASPRWGLVSPEEIQRIDFLYGLFAAMYPGNSLGGVLLITTRTPDKFEATVKQTEAFQTFKFYNTSDTYRTDQTAVTVGNRWENVSVFLAANYQNSYSQPLAWITTAGTPAGTSGTIPQLSRTGTIANVLGAGGLLHTEMFNLKGKVAVDLIPWLRATYVSGLWSNDQDSRVETYLRDGAGNPTYGGSATVGGAGFASNYYNLNQVNLANAFTLKTDTKGLFDWDVVVSRFDYLKDIQRNPFTVMTSGAAFIDTGRITRLDGSNWENADVRGIWRPFGLDGAHEVSFGAHGDRYELSNPAYRTPTWFAGPDSTSEFYSIGKGKTQTVALWV